MTADTLPTLYKFLLPDGTTPHGHATWPLPRGKRPGKWMPRIEGKLRLCANAYHVMDVSQLLQWAENNTVLYEIEWRGRHISDEEKHGVEQARLLRRVDAWNDRNLRLFACDCAERVLPLFERERPDDDRPRKAIETARRFANGEAASDELAAARAAAWAAARDAARAAAWTAAREAAWAAERTWQTERLAQYISGALDTQVVKVQA